MLKTEAEFAKTEDEEISEWWYFRLCGASTFYQARWYTCCNVWLDSQRIQLVQEPEKAVLGGVLSYSEEDGVN